MENDTLTTGTMPRIGRDKPPSDEASISTIEELRALRASRSGRAASPRDPAGTVADQPQARSGAPARDTPSTDRRVGRSMAATLDVDEDVLDADAILENLDAQTSAATSPPAPARAREPAARQLPPVTEPRSSELPGGDEILAQIDQQHLRTQPANQPVVPRGSADLRAATATPARRRARRAAPEPEPTRRADRRRRLAPLLLLAGAVAATDAAVVVGLGQLDRHAAVNHITYTPAAHTSANANDALTTLLPGLNLSTFSVQLGEDIHRLADSARAAQARRKPQHHPRARTLIHSIPTVATSAAPAVSSGAPISSSTDSTSAAPASSYSSPPAYSTPAASSPSSTSPSSSTGAAAAKSSSTSTKNTTPGPTGLGEAVGSNCNPSCS